MKAIIQGYYIASMEFVGTVLGAVYQFSVLNDNSVLVTGNNQEYILYKNKTWQCADEITSRLLNELADIIEEHTSNSAPFT